MESQKKLDKKTFQKIADLIYDKVGIVLKENKYSLVSSRVGKLMRQKNIHCFAEFMKLMDGPNSDDLLTELIDAISTNVTHFFREKRHFQVLSEKLKEWEAQGQQRFRIWCAASSTGEEPYSLAITIRESLNNPQNAKILATDICTDVLKKAAQGIYSKASMEKMPKRYITKYFTKKASPNGQISYHVKSELKQMVRFGKINLAKPPFPLKGPIDVVFCRNVMIYFDNQVRQGLLGDIKRILRPKGYLMVGHSESLSGMLSQLKVVEPSVYIKE